MLQKLQDIAPKSGLKKISLQVTTTQKEAYSLYRMLGFMGVGILKNNIYKDNTYWDETLMEWHLP